MMIQQDRPRPQRLWTVLTVAVAAAAVLVVPALHAFAGGGSDLSRREAAVSGYWQATGRVVQAVNSATQSSGETLHRRWWIRKLCDQTCVLEMTREVAGSKPQIVGGAITAPLVWSAGHWQATFEQADVACQGADGLVPAVEGSTWTITLSATGTITATESTTTHSPDCATGTSILIWTARKLKTQPALS
jgi:hypothetical protein